MKTVFTLSEVQAEREKARKRGTKEMIDVFLHALAIVLFDKHGMTKKEVKKLLDEIYRRFDNFYERRENLEDIKQVLKDEYDFEFIVS